MKTLFVSGKPRRYDGVFGYKQKEFKQEQYSLSVLNIYSAAIGLFVRTFGATITGAENYCIMSTPSAAWAAGLYSA